MVLRRVSASEESPIHAVDRSSSPLSGAIRRATNRLAVVALLLTAAACSSDDSGADTGGSNGKGQSATVDRDSTSVEPTWSLDLHPVTQPVVKDGVALVLTRAPGRSLKLVAADVSTGKRLWSRDWSPGGIPPGYSVEPVALRSASGKAVTVFSQPPRELAATSEDMWRLPLVVVDLATGKELHRTKPLELLTPPEECADHKDACFDLLGSKGGLRLDLDTGQLKPDPAGTPAGARNIGDAGLFSTSDRPGEKIGVARDGKTLWSRPIAEVMGPTVSSDNGWQFAYDEKADRYVGWMRAAPPPEAEEKGKASKVFTQDIGLLRLVAFDGTDGKVAWSRKGAKHTCLGIDTETPRVRCVLKGALVYSDKGEVTKVRGGAATVEGFDAETGKTTWSLPVAADAVADLITDRDQKVADGATALVQANQGPRVVDLATGETAEPTDDEVFVCASQNTSFDYAMPYFSDGEPITRRYGGQLLRPCSTDGTAAPAYTVASLTDAGEAAGKGRKVLASSDGLLGFEVP